MNNSWTGGQYSIFRFIFGVYLFVHFGNLIPWGTEVFSSAGALPDKSLSPLMYIFPNILLLSDAPWAVGSLLSLACVASLCFAFGYRDKLAAVLLWYVLACLFGRNPLTANPSLPFVGWLLLAHCLLPSNALGAVSTRGKDVSELKSWSFSPTLMRCAWILMCLAYTYSGVMKLYSPSWVDGSALVEVMNNPLARPNALRGVLLDLPTLLIQLLTWGALALEVLYAPLACISKLRPLLWLSMLLMHLGLLCVIQFADLTFGMIVLHLFTLDPAWIPRKKNKTPGQQPGERIIFYDGECGLCHRWVKVSLLEDQDNSFSFSPIQGDTIKSIVNEEEFESLPDSILVQTEDKTILSKSSAIVFILKSFGGLWRLLGILLALIPKFVRDAGYDFIASIRYKLFPKSKSLCPLMPAELQKRFLP